MAALASQSPVQAHVRGGGREGKHRLTSDQRQSECGKEIREETGEF